jgi:DNA invertase Pin-like site-specific DNA recombinase
MASGQFVAYYRVSTQKQGVSGLGLEAQETTVANYLKGVAGTLIATFTEIETGKGKDALKKRPQLRAALAVCRHQGATLVIAKLDRLARNVHFVSGLMESKVEFVACDLPEANPLTLHVMAAFAEFEAKRISQRTKDAIAAKKVRVENGTDPSGITDWREAWGVSAADNLKPNLEARKASADAFADKLRPTFKAMRDRGLSQRAMVAELNSIGVPTAKGAAWTLIQVQRVIARLAAIDAALM